ncbi:MAG: S8 family peptidase [Halanaerobiaceae bacterium]
MINCKSKKLLFTIAIFGIISSIIITACTQNTSLEKGMIKGEVKIDESDTITLSENVDSGNQIYENNRSPESHNINVSNNQNKYIIKLNQELNQKEFENLLGEEVVIENKINETTFSIKVNTADVDNYIESLKTEKIVSYIEPDIPVVPQGVPNDPLYNSSTPGQDQWNLHLLELEKVWQKGYTGNKDITVAVLDTGIVLDHPDLEDNLIKGKDFIDEDSDPYDDSPDFSHGTHVAGTIGAVTNNNEGIAGINWDVNIMPVRVMEETSGTSSQLAAGIEWAVDNGADIINFSLALTTNSSPQVLEEAVKYAYDKGVILVGAAGNEGSTPISYPARFPEVISVGAVDSNKKQASYSNYGEELDLVAPGSDILSTNTPVEQNGETHYYTKSSGTSMAAPHVSGIIALLLDAGYNNPDKIIKLLQQSAEDLGTDGFDEKYGYGLVNIEQALNLENSELDEEEGNDDSNEEENNQEISRENIKIYGVKSGSSYTDADTSIVNPDSGGGYSLEVAPGTWDIITWLDLNNNGKIDQGDLFNKIEEIELKENEVKKNKDIELKEII